MAPRYAGGVVVNWLWNLLANAGKMSMSVGKHAEFGRRWLRHWVAQARACAADTAQVLADMRGMIARCSDLARDVVTGCRAAGLDHDVLSVLVEKITARCRNLAMIYGQELSTTG